jgi:hypothetical protein
VCLRISGPCDLRVATSLTAQVWLILDGMVLDVGRWLPEHPGGASIIPKQSLNLDCARFFEVRRGGAVGCGLQQPCALPPAFTGAGGPPFHDITSTPPPPPHPEKHHPSAPCLDTPLPNTHRCTMPPGSPSCT